MEHTAPLFVEALVILGGGIAAGTLFKRIGLGTVLGYLAAGLVLGPVGGFVDHGGEEILHLGELGVVFLLFVIGLELKLSRLWSLRRQIFGLGLAQVMATGALLTGALTLVPALGWRAAAVIGFGLALSSTAFALQLLEERGELNTRFGQAAFSVLLFQDLAIVPLLALLPLLDLSSAGVSLDGRQILLSFGALGALVVAGRYLLNPLFRVLAAAGAREVMTATALFVVLASALLMQLAGFSMAMGAFVAGVLLAESSYRHELEANIDPFRGLLLGLFFIAVGLSIDIAVVAANWWIVLAGAPLLMLAKFAVLYALCRLFGESHAVALRTATVLPQGGEFAFVLFSAATSSAILDGTASSILVSVVTLTMALTPLTAALGRRFAREDEVPDEMEEDFADAGGSDVLMIGFSRFGQIAAQVMLSSGLEMTILDASAERIQTAGRFGFRIYFGSGLRRDVLEAAGIRQAKIVAVCTNKPEITDAIVDLVRSEFPNVRLFVRSYDRNHALRLRERGVDYEIRETLESALQFGGASLRALGLERAQVGEIVEDVRRRDAERLALQLARVAGDGTSLASASRKVTPEPLTKPASGRKPRGAKPRFLAQGTTDATSADAPH